jgi:hypothetical protein
MPIVTLQPSTGLDTFILHFAGQDDTNFYTDPVLTIQPYSATIIKRILTKFDLTTIPTDANINSAKIGLKLTSAVEATSISMEAHEISRSWVPSAVTWNKYDGTTAWSIAGGDYGTTVIDAVNVGNTLQVYEWSITPLIVQGWLTTNNGVLFKGSNEASGVSDKSFVSARGTTASDRPYITIDYSIGGASRKLLGVGA